MNKKHSAVLSTSQAITALGFLFLGLTLATGYAQNLIAGRADAWLILAGAGIALAALGIAARWFVVVTFEPLELAGWLLVTLSVWHYFVAAASPTLLPPTQSLDAVRAAQHAAFTFPEGKLIGGYPGGGAFLVALLAHWLDWLPFRVLHLVAASFAAVSAGAVYGMACALLPQNRVAKIAALVAPALLFLPGSDFAGALIGSQYLFAPLFAQTAVLGAGWFTASYARAPHWVFAALIGVAWLVILAAHPGFLFLPVLLFASVALLRAGMALFAPAPPVFADAPESLTRAQPSLSAAQIIATLGILLALIVCAAATWLFAGVTSLNLGQPVSPKIAGARAWFDYLGWVILLGVAGGGVWRAWQAGAFGRTLLGLGVLWLAQAGVLLGWQWFEPTAARASKTLPLLVGLLATLAAPFVARGVMRLARGRALLVGAVTLAVCGGVWLTHLPRAESPLTESEIQVALWARDFFNNTYQINYLDEQPASAHWLSFGIWNEAISPDGSSWRNAPRVLAPATFEDWLEDADWGDRLLVRDVTQVPQTLRVLYQFGDAAILEKDLPPILDPHPAYRADYNFANTLTLLGYSIPKTTFAPGETVIVTTYTQSLYPPPAPVRWRVELVDRNGKVAQRLEREPFNAKYPLQRWPPGKYKHDNWVLPLEPNIVPGTYTLRLGLFQPQDDAVIGVLPVYATNRVAPLSAAPLGQITITTLAK